MFYYIPADRCQYFFTIPSTRWDNFTEPSKAPPQRPASKCRGSPDRVRATLKELDSEMKPPRLIYKSSFDRSGNSPLRHKLCQNRIHQEIQRLWSD